MTGPVAQRIIDITNMRLRGDIIDSDAYHTAAAMSLAAGLNGFDQMCLGLEAKRAERNDQWVCARD